MASLAADKSMLSKNLFAMVCLLSFLGVNCSSSRLPAEKITPNVSEEISNETFKIHVLSYSQVDGAGIQKSYYVFETARVNSDDWQVLLQTSEKVENIFQTASTGLPVYRHMECLSEQVGYVFAERAFVVSVDGGQNWKRVDLSSHFSEPMVHKDAFIGEVENNKNGRGTLTIYEYRTRGDYRRYQQSVKTLYTCDFGQSWSEKQSLCAS